MKYLVSSDIKAGIWGEPLSKFNFINGGPNYILVFNKSINTENEWNEGFFSAISEKVNYLGNLCPNLFLEGGLKGWSAFVTFTTMSNKLCFIPGEQ